MTSDSGAWMGAGMMIAGVLSALLRLGLLASPIVVAWVGIGRLRRETPGTEVGEHR